MHISRLPFEMISMIAQELDVDDIFNFGSTSRLFIYLLRDNAICKHALRVGLQYVSLLLRSLY